MLSSRTHEFECASCGKKGDRHQVSARVSALLLKILIEQVTIAVT
nr:hypothetical protein [Candidatus Sigynarchaeota archaeon]